MQVRRLFHSYRAFAATLAAVAFLLLGSGAVQTMHLRAANACARSDGTCEHHRPCSHPSNEESTSHDEDTCGVCVALALAGGAPAFIDAPILPLGVLTCVEVVDTAVLPSPSPLRCLAARPPPTAT